MTDTNQPSVLTTSLRLGLNKSKARLWIEGTPLTTMGWVRGTVFKVRHSPDFSMLQYVAESHGGAYSDIPGRPRRVAGTSTRPIIDTNTNDLVTTLGVPMPVKGAKDNPQLAIRITPTQIIISRWED